jgi:hypothetical protein
MRPRPFDHRRPHPAVEQDGQMQPLIIALHRDPAPLMALRWTLSRRIDADIVFVDSLSAALDVIDAGTPDLILVDPLIPPNEADHLTSYLALLPAASHVQTISVPLISSSANGEPPRDVATRRRSFWRTLWPRRRSRVAPPALGWNPGAFADEVSAYLSLSQWTRRENEETNDAREFYRKVDRRQATRSSAQQAQLLEPVYVVTDRADLVDISSTGVLVRTDVRPYPRAEGLQNGQPGNWSPLVLYSTLGDLIRRAGTPVRCRAKSLGDGRFRYEVAFRFDEPLSLANDVVTAESEYRRYADGARRRALPGFTCRY